MSSPWKLSPRHCVGRVGEVESPVAGLADEAIVGVSNFPGDQSRPTGQSQRQRRRETKPPLWAQLPGGQEETSHLSGAVQIERWEIRRQRRKDVLSEQAGAKQSHRFGRNRLDAKRKRSSRWVRPSGVCSANLPPPRGPTGQPGSAPRAGTGRPRFPAGPGDHDRSEKFRRRASQSQIRPIMPPSRASCAEHGRRQRPS
jgi:hypothetical protein